MRIGMEATDGDNKLVRWFIGHSKDLMESGVPGKENIMKDN